MKTVKVDWLLMRQSPKLLNNRRDEEDTEGEFAKWNPETM
jgi:hypothetical protein